MHDDEEWRCDSHRVPMFLPYGSVCCACAQRPGLPCQSFLRTLKSLKTNTFRWVQNLGTGISRYLRSLETEACGWVVSAHGWQLKEVTCVFQTITTSGIVTGKLLKDGQKYSSRVRFPTLLCIVLGRSRSSDCMHSKIRLACTGPLLAQ